MEITARALYAELQAERTRLTAIMETAAAASTASGHRRKEHDAFVAARMNVRRMNETLRAVAATFTRMHNAAK